MTNQDGLAEMTPLNRYKVDSATLMNDSDFDDDEFYGSDSDSGK